MPYAATAGTTNGRSVSVWAGRILSGLVVLFLLLDGAMKLVPLQPVIDSGGELGWPTDFVTLRTLGVVLIGSALLYAYPRTAMLGAILITGYLGGAVATHARIGSPLFSHTLFGVYVGVLAWGGLWFRDRGLRARLPLRR
jgi:hypothetical protein